MNNTADQVLCFAQVLNAQRRIADVARDTPTLVHDRLDEIVGCRVLLKCECFQITGSFKFRGAYNALAHEIEINPDLEAVVTCSSGNHAKAVAKAALLLGLESSVFMSSDAPVSKMQAIEPLGSRLRLYDRHTESREALIQQHLQQGDHISSIPPFDHAEVMAGQGTIALEMLAANEGLATIIAPLGGGGLMSGIARASRSQSTVMRLIGVETTGADDWAQSLGVGRPVEIPPPDTIADGIRVTSPGTLTWPIVSRLINEVVTVPDAAVKRAVTFAFEELKIVLEPSGAVSLAALMEGRVSGLTRDDQVGVVLSGGNVDASMLCSILQDPPTKSEGSL